MAEFAAMRTLDVWYAHMSEADIKRRCGRSKKPRSSKPSKRKTGKKKKQGADKAGNADAALVAEKP